MSSPEQSLEFDHPSVGDTKLFSEFSGDALEGGLVDSVLLVSGGAAAIRPLLMSRESILLQ